MFFPGFIHYIYCFPLLKGTTCSNVGRVLCVVLLIIVFIAFVFMIVAFIIILKDYVDIEDDFEGKFRRNKDWCVVIFPVILTIISLIIMALIGNYLYRYSSDRLSSYPRELIKKLKAVFRMFHNQEYSQIMLKAFRLIFNNVQLILIINKNKIE